MTQSTKSFVEVPRTARYYKLNTVSQKTENIWIVFHGYGQLSEYFIKHFEELDAEENFIIAPEGLSRFYVDGLTGRVGASWMTKEDREEEIKDQSNYINAVLNDAGVDFSDVSYRFIVLGFSQGTATAVRWFANNGIRPSQLVLWAGSFPHDVNAIEQSDIFKNLPVHFVYGDKDQFLKDVNIEEKTAEFENMGMKLSVWPFEGKHVMDRPTLAKIVGSFDH
ncbi:MAG: serine hydrolase family protein [Flavobacteriales bacterium]|nr:serine hydrolase family protein [Flavobacteriales bacterium]